jgi:glycerol uptake facilitator-like aquaporin
VKFTLGQRLSAEFLGTAGIVAVVLGTSHMAGQLAAVPSVDLVMNALATAGALFVLISLFASVSGSHFNPVVTLVFWLRKEIAIADAAGYVVAQIAGAISGALLANLMFGEAVFAQSQNIRSGVGIHIAEVVASFGLVLVILLLGQQGKSNLIPIAVPLWILAGYFFTSSTSFANPAVTIGRGFSDAGSSIALESVPMFIVTQVLGAVLALGAATLFKPKNER